MASVVQDTSGFWRVDTTQRVDDEREVAEHEEYIELVA